MHFGPIPQNGAFLLNKIIIICKKGLLDVLGHLIVLLKKWSKSGQNGPFRVNDRENGIDGCDGMAIMVILPI